VGASIALYKNAARRAQAAVRCGRRAMVVDVGAGSFGAEQMHTFRKCPDMKGVAAMCLIPEADSSDAERITRLQANPIFKTFNYVPETKMIKTDVVNYCHHKASECTCMAYADNVFPVCIHSAYYLKQADLRNIFKKANSMETLVHMPEVGMGIPLSKPEFQWLDATEEGTKTQRWKSKFKELLTGVKQVVMKPVQTGGTTYRHNDIAQIVKGGGIHLSPSADEAERLSDDPLKVAAHLAGAFAGGFVGGFLLTSGLSTKYKVGAGLCAGAALVAGKAMRVINAGASAYLPDPPADAESTLTTVPLKAFVESESKDVLAHVVKFVKSKPSELEERVIAVKSVNPEAVSTATSTLLLAPDTEKSKRQTAATMLRNGHKVKVTHDSMEQAVVMAKYLNGALTHAKELPPGYWKDGLTAFFTCLPFVCLILYTSMSILSAGLSLLRGSVRAPSIGQRLQSIHTIPLYLWSVSAAKWLRTH